MVTNLVYHVFASGTEMMWWNIRTIKPYLPIFNGKRVFTIAVVEQQTKLVDEIVRYLGDDNEYIVVENDINVTYGGTGPFFELSGPMVANENHDEFMFHGHTKGASYQTINPSVLFWTKFLYDINLGRFDMVREVLKTHDTFGIFKCVGTAFGNRVNWHYPGAFWWVRHSSLFSHPWNMVERDACATEILPSQFVSNDRAFDGLKLPFQFMDPHKPYAADKLYGLDHWKSYLNTQDLTQMIRNILDANT